MTHVFLFGEVLVKKGEAIRNAAPGGVNGRYFTDCPQGWLTLELQNLAK
jgi:hypothetical protein